VAALIVQQLLPVDAAVLVAVDDSLFRRSGRRVHAAAWCHDGAAKGPKGNRIGWGNCWVIAGLVLTLPFLDRPICLPVTARLWRKNGPTKQVLAGQLVTGLAKAIAANCPGHAIHVVADAWYAGTDGAAGAARHNTRQRVGFPPQASLTSRLRVNAALHAIANPIPGRGGRPRRIGAKLGTPKHVAATAAGGRPASTATAGTPPSPSPTSTACGTASTDPAPYASSCSATGTPPPATTWP
jgi:hypothetical protein